MPKVGKDITSADIAYFKAMRLAHPKWFRQLMIETAVFLSVMGTLLVVDWKRFLLYVMIPHLYAAWGIITMNLLQHDGTDADTDFNHSRNFVGKLVNFWTYNNGYHTIHHMEAGLHWSLAPAEHATRVKPFMDPRLDEPSMLAYLWRTFGWPGQRLRYDGKPVIAPPAGRDEPWIPLPEETPHEVSLGAGA